jgi:hypothetical protein
MCNEQRFRSVMTNSESLRDKLHRQRSGDWS